MRVTDEHQERKKEWVVVSVIGRDRPGIVAAVSRVLFQHGINIEQISQTILMGQFSMILIASIDHDALRPLTGGCADLARVLDLDIHVREIRQEDRVPFHGGATEPYVITVRGEDQPGLICGITSILAESGINITNLEGKVIRMEEKLEPIQIFEVDVPQDLDLGFLQEQLRQRGQEMKVAVDIQHREVFRAINRI